MGSQRRLRLARQTLAQVRQKAVAAVCKRARE
jgi:hypothetical protein